MASGGRRTGARGPPRVEEPASWSSRAAEAGTRARASSYVSPVSISRSTIVERTWARITSAESMGWAPAVRALSRADRGQRVAGTDREPTLLQLGGDLVGDVGQVGDQRRRTRAAPAPRSRWPRWPAGPGPGCCGSPGPAARAGRRWPARRAGAGGGTVRGARPRSLRRTATAARRGRARSPGPAAACRGPARRRAAPAPGRCRAGRRRCRPPRSPPARAACAGERPGRRSPRPGRRRRRRRRPASARARRPGWATSVVMITACTPDWVDHQDPGPEQRRDAHRRHRHDGHLPDPRPEQLHEQVPDEHADGHADDDLGHPAQPLPERQAEGHDRRDRCEERLRVPQEVLARSTRRSRRQGAHWHDEEAALPQPVQALPGRPA